MGRSGGDEVGHDRTFGPEGEVLAGVRQNGVGVLSLNRPDRHNAISDALRGAWREALAWALEDRAVRCLLVRGAGPSFSSGRDTAELGRRAYGDSHFDYVRRAQDDKLALAEASKPVVAAIRGYALGGGFELALAADIRIATPEARLALPEIRFGLLPDTGGSQRVAALAGEGRAKYLMMTGDQISGQQAYDWGIVDLLAEDNDLDTFAADLASRVAQGSAVALAAAKQLADQLHGPAIRAGTRQELFAQLALTLDRGSNQ